jgi:hypothetical protein
MAVTTIAELKSLLNKIDEDARVLAAIVNDSANSTVNGLSAGFVTTRLGDEVQNVQAALNTLGNEALFVNNNGSDFADIETVRSNLGLVIGTDVQAYTAVLAATTVAYTTAAETKLNDVETAATADQTGAEIKTAYEAEADTNALTDALLAKLNNISAFGALLVDDTDAQTARTTLEVDQAGEALAMAIALG